MEYLTVDEDFFRTVIERQREIFKRIQIIEAFIGCNQVCPFARSNQFLSKEIIPLKAVGKYTFHQRITELDEISRIVLQIIAFNNPLNITQITNRVRTRRGKASRRIIRQRINRLVNL